MRLSRLGYDKMSRSKIQQIIISNYLQILDYFYRGTIADLQCASILMFTAAASCFDQPELFSQTLQEPL